MVPGLRRLLHPHRHAAADAGDGRAARGHRVRVGDRLRGPVPVLHEHLRPARHPRPLPGGGHGPGHGPGRPARVGGGRRRRHDVDRGQPPDPRAASQREPQHPAVQQPDLRAHQGPVLTHQRAGQGDQVHAPRLGGAALQRGVAGPGGGGLVRGPHPRHGPGPHAGDVPAGPQPPRGGVRGGLPELQRVQ